MTAQRTFGRFAGMTTHDATGVYGHAARVERSDRPETATTVASSRRRVALVVDDEAMIAALLADVIEAHGWRAIIALGSAHAIALAEEHAVDVLVTDLEMPGMSGLSLAGRLRARLGDSLPVLLVSGSPAAPDAAMEMPFAFLPKPFALPVFMATLNGLCAGQAGGSAGSRA